MSNIIKVLDKLAKDSQKKRIKKIKSKSNLDKFIKNIMEG